MMQRGRFAFGSGCAERTRRRALLLLLLLLPLIRDDDAKYSTTTNTAIPTQQAHTSNAPISQEHHP